MHMAMTYMRVRNGNALCRMILQPETVLGNHTYNIPFSRLARLICSLYGNDLLLMYAVNGYCRVCQRNVCHGTSYGCGRRR